MINHGKTVGGPSQHLVSLGLKRSIGLWTATALVVGNMVGSGVFLLPASLADAAT